MSHLLAVSLGLVPVLAISAASAQSRLSPAALAPTSIAQATSPAASVRPAADPAPAGGLQTQTVTLRAGIGMLVQLPHPAASVMSANPGVARVQPTSPTSLFLMGVAVGRTTVLATADTGAAIAQYEVVITPGETGAPPPAVLSAPLPSAVLADPGDSRGGPATVTSATARAIELAIAQSIIGAGSVRVRANGATVMLTGNVPNAMAAETASTIARAYLGDKTTVINNLEVLGSIQVNVRVRIAEISRTVTRQLGFNWQALGTGSNWKLGLLTGAAVGGRISAQNALGLTPLAGAGAAPAQLGAAYTSGRWDINGVIDALATDQLISILAEPNLTAQSGETASFLAGGEFPIPIASSGAAGSTTVTVEFKQFGVSLAVIPTVLSSKRVNLRVRPEVSQLSNNGAVSVPTAGGGTLTIPALTVRRAETTVELGSGQSFAIAGLLQKTSSDATNAVPGIGELPVIGALFKSNDFQRGESELVIIVTPYLVKPANNPDDLHLPTDGFKPATDLDRILLGRQITPQPGGAALDAGFILK